MSTEETFIDRLKAQIEAHQHQIKMFPHDRQAQIRLETLQTALDTAERRQAEMARALAEQDRKWQADQERIRKQREAYEAEQAEKMRAHEERRVEALEADLRQRYEDAAPGPVSDSEWRRVRGQILHDYRLAHMTNLEQEVAATAKRFRI